MTPAQAPPPASPEPSKLPRYLLIGCVSVTALLILGGIVLYFTIWAFVNQVAENLTTDRPISVAQVTMSAEELAALERRIEDFGSAMEGEAPATPLVLSADEINALIQRHGKLDRQGIQAVVRIIGRQLEAEISVPAEKLLPNLAGRYVNGKTVLSVGVVNERVVVYIQDLRVGDQYVPDRVRERLSRENLLRDAYGEDSDLARALSRIRSVEIRDGSLILTPAPPAR